LKFLVNREVAPVSIVRYVRLFVVATTGVKHTITGGGSYASCGNTRRKASTPTRRTVKSLTPHLIGNMGKKTSVRSYFKRDYSEGENARGEIGVSIEKEILKIKAWLERDGYRDDIAEMLVKRKRATGSID